MVQVGAWLTEHLGTGEDVAAGRDVVVAVICGSNRSKIRQDRANKNDSEKNIKKNILSIID